MVRGNRGTLALDAEVKPDIELLDKRGVVKV
jgi:hypothetical protein